MALRLQQLIGLLVVAKPLRFEYKLFPCRVPTLRSGEFYAVVVFIARQER